MAPSERSDLDQMQAGQCWLQDVLCAEFASSVLLLVKMRLYGVSAEQAAEMPDPEIVPTVVLIAALTEAAPSSASLARPWLVQPAS